MTKLKAMFKYAFLILNIISYKAHGQHILIDNDVNVSDTLSFIWFLEKEIEDTPTYGFYNILENIHSNHKVKTTNEHRIDLAAFHMPCKNNLVTSSYGYRKSFRRNHMGTDIKVYVGDTMYSIFSGVVNISSFDKAGYGNYVRIKHDNGLETLYAHMSKRLVKKDQIVKVGEPIGLGGNTGRSTGSHLHFEVRLSGKYINPEELFCFETKKPLVDHILVKDGKIVKNEIVENVVEEKEILHKVKRGESLALIAKKYNTSVEKLKKMNGLNRNTILVGQILRCS